MKKGLGVLLIGVLLPYLVMAGESLTLDQCVEIALKHNPQLAQTRFSKDIAGQDVIVAVSNFLPSARFGISYNHSEWDIDNYVNPQTNELVSNTVDWNYGSNLQVEQTLFNGGYNFFNLKNYIARKRSANFDLEDTRQQIIYTVKERYYNLLKGEKLLQVSQEALKSSEESFKLADAKYQVGTAPKSEMLQFKVELENAKLALIEAQHNVSLARTSLNHVLGLEMEQEIAIVDDLELPEVDISFKDAVQSGIENHPLVLRSTANVDAARATVGLAVSQYLPSVGAWYNYSWQNRQLEEIKHMTDRDYSWSAGVSLSIPIFQGGARFANLGKARLNHKMNKEALNYNRREVDLQVKQAYYTVQQAKKKIAVTEDAEAAADETLRLNKEKYNLGAGTMLDLINAQSSYTEARSNRIQALYDYKFAVARLQRAMGQLTQ